MEKKTEVPAFLWILSVVIGIAALGIGLLGTLLIFIWPTLAEGPLSVVLIGVGSIAVVLGIGLLVTGLKGYKRLPSPKFHTPWGWSLFLLLTISFIVIAMIIPASWHHHPLFAALHLGMAVFPALFLLSLVTLAAGRPHAPTVRQLVATTSGGAAATLFALPVEIAGLIVGTALIVLVAYLFPGSKAEIAQLTALIDQWTTNPPVQIDEVLPILASPIVLGVLALTLGVIAPITEEFGKILVMGVLGIWRRPSLTRAFLWGAACGLGFAIVESVANGANGLGEVLGWLGGMGARALATSMHMLTSGIIGLGWGFFWRKHRWKLPLAYICAVAFHGLWNLNIVAVIGSVGIGAQSSPAGFLFAIAGTGFQLVLGIFTPLALIGIPFVLRRYESRTPLH